MLHLVGWLGTRRRLVRYEDFVADPAAMIRDVLRFGGVTGAALDYVAGRTLRLSPHHSIGGNPMRFGRGPTEVKLDDTWRTALPTRERRLVTALALPLLMIYGYLRRSRS